MKEINYKDMGFKDKEMYDFPRIVNAEVYRGNCPCSCVHCPVGLTEPDKRKEKFGGDGMKISLYEKIIEEMSQYKNSALRVHSAGEPLLWENLTDALKISKYNDVNSWLFTSAVTGNKDLLFSVCENSDIVEVSVNSITPDDYRKTKGIDAYELVTENIKYMNGLKQKGLPLRLIVSRVESDNKSTNSEFVEYWKSSNLVDDAFVRTYHTYNDILPEKNEDQSEHKHDSCLVHWARFNINVDGNVVVCFNELFKDHIEPPIILGNVNDNKIKDIWHGEKMTALREAELTGNYYGFEKLPCKNCYSCQPLNSNKETSEHQLNKLGEQK